MWVGCGAFLPFLRKKFRRQPPERIGEPAGTPFLILLVEESLMLGACLNILKNVMRTYLDNYILPGTHTGTQILWLYLVQWRRDLVALIAVSFTTLSSNVNFSVLERFVQISDDQKEHRP